MHIVHVLKHCDNGGNVHVAVDLACAQAAMGHDVVLASGGGKYEKLLQNAGVLVANVVQDQRRPLTLLAAAAGLLRIHRERRLDIIHAHMMSGAMVGFAASVLTGVPLVTTVHNSFDRHSVLMRLGHRVVAVSAAEKALLTKRGYKPERVDIVLNGPNGSARERSLGGFEGPHIESPCVTTVCGLHQRKGVSDLIRAFSEASRDLPQWRLYIVGDGPDRAALKKLATEVGPQDRIVFVGLVPVARPVLEQSDIFVLASYADPCSLSVTEARGAGCAIIATAVGGTPELLEFGRAGRLVEPGNPRQLAAELRRLMISDRARAELRIAAKQGADFFDIARVATDYDLVYHRAKMDGGSP
jgi:glycosyltransferase involved in cell wall biosynthesis